MLTHEPPFPEWIYRQSAALPCRWRGDDLEVLLITNRRGSRWIVPKGIVEPGFTPQASAARETVEEAGVRGTIADEALGAYQREKWGGTCEVTVYPLAVSEELPDWQDASFRRRQWFSVPDALSTVAEDGLRAVIAGLPEIAPEPGTFLGRFAEPEPQARLVYVVRHAEAEPAGGAARDFDRGLTSRGLADCARMHRYLSMADVEPQLVLSSAARRARETLDAFMPAIGAPEVRELPELYDEDAAALARRLGSTEPGRQKVMLVGHNPALRFLVEHLAASPPAARNQRPDVGFAPCALAILVFHGSSWDALTAGSCELHSLVAPSDLGTHEATSA